LLKYFSNGSKRTIIVKKNIVASLVLKFIGMVASYIVVPLTISYLNPVKYGIWITLTSFVGWFYLMDIGLGNGLKTNLLEAFAKNDTKLAKIHISNAYFFTGIIIFIFYFLFIIVNPFLKWSLLLNAPAEYDAELNRLIFFIFTFFTLQFVLRLINVILASDQKPFISELINMLPSLFSLMIIFILVKFTQSSLLVFGICFSAIPVIISLFFTLYFFNKKYRKIIPSYKFIDFKKGKKLTNLSLKFFIVQIAATLLYTTQNFIISHILGPEEVTPYNIVYKYFFIITTMYSIINGVTLTGFADAYFKDDLYCFHMDFREAISFTDFAYLTERAK